MEIYIFIERSCSIVIFILSIRPSVTLQANKNLLKLTRFRDFITFTKYFDLNIIVMVFSFNKDDNIHKSKALNIKRKNKQTITLAECQN